MPLWLLSVAVAALVKASGVLPLTDPIALARCRLGALHRRKPMGLDIRCVNVQSALFISAVKKVPYFSLSFLFDSDNRIREKEKSYFREHHRAGRRWLNMQQLLELGFILIN